MLVYHTTFAIKLPAVIFLQSVVKMGLAIGELSILCLNVVINTSMVINGIYDLMCAACILRYPNIGLSKLHLKVFGLAATGHIGSTLLDRLMAYFIISYGLPRVVAGIYFNIGCDIIAAFTYFLEGAVYGLECWGYESTPRAADAKFVSVSSCLLGVLVILRTILQSVFQPPTWFSHGVRTEPETVGILLVIISLTCIAWLHGIISAVRSNPTDTNPADDGNVKAPIEMTTGTKM